jgi:hypothetical protein
MIANADEYQKAQQELGRMENWLQKLQREFPTPAKGFTKAGVRKMIARLHEELALYEGGLEVEQIETTTPPP